VVVTKSYEVHGPATHYVENEDGFVDHDPQYEADDLSWWRKCFVPRFPDYAATESSVTTQTKEGEARNRFYSADVTVSTNQSSPPATPDPVAGASSDAETSGTTGVTSNTDTVHSDLEMPSIRNDISAIHEEIEELDGSDRVAILPSIKTDLSPSL
jgi:hypothetical protein